MYIYKITNLINNKIYIGQTIHDNPKYLGGGRLIKMAIKKYGRKNFLKEILEICSKKEDLSKKEIYWIKKFNSRDPKIGYNMAEGGASFYINEESRKKISESLKGKYIGKNAFRHGIKLTEEHKKIISKSNKGKIFSNETRKKMSKSRIGIIYSLETRKKMSESHRGKKLTNDHKERIGNSLIGRKYSEESIKKLRNNNLNKNQKNSLYVIAKNLQTSEELVFNNSCQASRFFKCTRQRIKNNQVNGWEIKTFKKDQEK
jgi:group I intron endonuclease